MKARRLPDLLQVPGRIGLGRPGRRDDVQLAGKRAVLPGITDPFRVRGPFVVEQLAVVDDGFQIAAVRVHGAQLAGAQKGDALAVRGEIGAEFGIRRIGELLDLEAMGLEKLLVIRVIGFQKVDVLLAVAVGQEHDLATVRRPGDGMIVGVVMSRHMGEPLGLAAAARHQEDLPVHHQSDQFFIVGQGIFGGAVPGGLAQAGIVEARASAGEIHHPIGIGLVVGMDLDGQLARQPGLGG